MYDKYIVRILIAGTILIVIFALFLIILIVYMKAKQNSVYMDRQRFIFDNQNDQIQESERIINEVAKNVHDNILQIACLVQMNLHGIESMVKDIPALEASGYVLELNSQVIETARNLLDFLNIDFLKANNLVFILESELGRMFKTKKINYHLDVKGNIRALNPEIKVPIYRIAMSAMKNVLKHASASSITVLLDFQHDFFSMEINDDGIGFSSEKLHPEQKIGLIYMYKRAKLLNGELIIDSTPGEGCKVTLTCPC